MPAISDVPVVPLIEKSDVYGWEVSMNKCIMSVDDSATIRQMVAFTLKEAGYEVIEAVDGEDALRKLKTATVHMILADLNMPNMDGVTLVKRVRTDPGRKGIPIVMLTTESQESKKQEARSAGATGWIVKPFRPDQLLGVIKKVLG